MLPTCHHEGYQVWPQIPDGARAACLQVRKRKWDSLSSGEELFGLQTTPYPELEQTEKEIAMLDRLYT